MTQGEADYVDQEDAKYGHADLDQLRRDIPDIWAQMK